MKQLLDYQINALFDCITEATEYDLKSDHIRSLAKMTEAQIIMIELEDTLSMSIVPVSQVRYIIELKERITEIKKMMKSISNSLIKTI
jgi:hypothetical protein